ncbi:MAG TPA: GNAT family N-acetyltransferase [Clostridiales bacterium UBA8960]|jgi:ribosomal protein S18 acetylase RimI-like enzyme|nr:GNAT family N-acetyltransferase [Clostridiales bacterium UBA8960]
MITYKLGTETDKKDIHKAFHAGFIDYIMKVDIPEDVFFKRFFGPEANTYDLAVIAYDGSEPVGLVMGGIKAFDGGAKTMRCGGLCVVPEFRGKGISQELMRMHKQMALDNGCKQIMLEVIGGNDRAIQFYKNIGYSIVYLLDYFSAETENLKTEPLVSPKIFEVEKEDLHTLDSILGDVHMNWQNDSDYISQLDNVRVFAIHTNDQIVSYVAIDDRGKIYQLWTHKAHRYNGHALALLHHAKRTLKLDKMMMSFPNSATLTGFAQKVGFKKDGLYQYEMYAVL